MLKYLIAALLFTVSCTIVAQNTPQLVIPTLDRFSIDGVHYIPAKKYLLSNGSDDNLKFWQLSDGRMVKSLAVDPMLKPVATTVSPDGKTSAFVATYQIGWVNVDDFTIKPSEEMPESEGRLGHSYTAATFSRDGKTLFVGSGNYDRIIVWKVAVGGTKLTKFGSAQLEPQDLDPADGSGGEAVKGIKSICASPDGKSLVVSAGNTDLYAFTIADGKVKRLSQANSNAHGFLMNGLLVGSLINKDGQSSTLRLFDNTFKETGTFQVPFPVLKIVPFPKSNQCILMGSEQYAVLNADSRKLESTVKLPSKGIVTMAIDPEERELVYGGISDEKTSLANFDLRTKKDQFQFGESIFQTEMITRDPRASWFLLSKSSGGFAKIVKIQDGALAIRTLPSYGLVARAALASNGLNGVLGGFGSDAQFFNLKDRNLQYSSVDNIQFLKNGFVLSEDGSLMAALTEQGVVIYNTTTRKQLIKLVNKADSQYNNEVFSGNFSPDNKFFVGTWGGLSAQLGVKCWDVATGKVVWNVEGVAYSNFKYSADSKEIFCISTDFKARAAVWLNAATGQVLRSVKLDIPFANDVSLSVSPDNNVILEKSGIILHDAKTGKKLAEYTPNGVINGAEILAGGQYGLVAYTSSADEDNLQSKLVLYDFVHQKVLANIYLYDETDDWAIITPDGHYDASAGAMKKMYYAQGTTLISLEALSEKFYVPKLLSQLLEGYTPPANEDIKTLKAPPTVKIGVPVQQRNLIVEDEIANIRRYEIGFEKISLTIDANSMDDIVSEIRLFHNGKLLGDGTRNLIVEDDTPTRSKSQKFEIQLVNGENVFKAIALNSQKTESSPDEILVNYKAPVSSNTENNGIQLHLVVIGINKYKNPKYNLNYATADATSFKDALEKGGSSIFSKTNVFYIGDDKATKEGISAELEKVKTTANPQDVFIFYYAGHGVINEKKEFYLVPHDVTQLYGQEEALAQKGLNATQLQQFSKDIKAQKQLFILDACQSAGALDQVVASRGAAEEKAIAQLARSTGTHWLTASGSEQFASEFAQLGHGTFTYVLLDAMSGKADMGGDGKITVKEIDAYLQEQVPILTEKYKGTPQYPASYGYGNDFPISIKK